MPNNYMKIVESEDKESGILSGCTSINDIRNKINKTCMNSN